MNSDRKIYVSKQYVDDCISNIVWDTLPGKPFDVEGSSTVIFEEALVEGFELLNNSAGYEIRQAIVEGVSIDLQVGEIYTVVWDGTQYICEAVLSGPSSSDTEETVISIGDVSLGGLSEDIESTGEPFLISVSPTYGNTVSVVSIDSTASKHTIKISAGHVAVSIRDEYKPVFEKSYDELVGKPFGILNSSPYVRPEYLPVFQSDWNENDEEAPGYVKNRPFYTGLEEVNVVYGDYRFEQDFASSGKYGVEIQQNHELIVGETYKVWIYAIINRNYECKSLYGMPYIGNLSIMSTSFEDTGEPFIIFSEGGTMACVLESSVGTRYYTIQVYGPAYVDYQIDEKYLPETIKSTTAAIGNLSDLTTSEKGTIVGAINEVNVQSDWNQTDSTAVDYIKNKPEALNVMVFIDQVTGYKYQVYVSDAEVVVQPVCTGIEIVTMPTKLTYWADESFNPAGMEVQAVYSDGSSKTIDDYIYEATMVDGNPAVIISYVELHNTFTTTFAVSVSDNTLAAEFIDFEYTVNEDNTVSLDAWKGTRDGVASSQCVIPDGDGFVTVLI